jgi:hypothetical protein
MISIAGIGVRDGTLYALYNAIGKSKEAAVALSTLMLIQFTFWSIVGLFAWIRRPLDIALWSQRIQSVRGKIQK